MDIKNEIKELEEELISLRRDFHKHPELGFNEKRTSRIVAEYLRNCNIEVMENIAKTGVVGLLKGKEKGKTIMLRADMDALPIEEENDVSYKSINSGVMHACGHDGHTAILMIAAKILTKYKDKIKGNIKFVFQPDEETAGAKPMIQEGVLEEPKVDAAFALHLWSPMKSGNIGVSSGAVWAGLHEFKLTIKGKGGHTSAPHLSVDPIITLADIINTVQNISTREIDPLKPTVIMFGSIKAGTANNIIPEKVITEGTIRYLYQGGDNSEERPHKRFERIIDSICKAHRCKYDLDYFASSPPVYNNSNLVPLVKKAAEEVVCDTNNIKEYVCLGGEDFAEFSKLVPSVFYFIGTGNKEKGTDFPHHHSRFNIDEETLKTGVEMHIRTVINYFNI